MYFWFRILYPADNQEQSSKWKMCSNKQQQARTLSSMIGSGSNSAQSSATFSSRVFFKAKSGIEREWKISLYMSIAWKNLFDTACETLYIWEIYQPDLAHIEVNRKPPTGFTGLWFRFLCFNSFLPTPEKHSKLQRFSLLCSPPASLHLLPCSSLMGAPFNSPSCYCSEGFNDWCSTLIALENSISRKEFMQKWFYGLHENVGAIIVINQTAMSFLIQTLRQADVTTHNSQGKWKHNLES